MAHVRPKTAALALVVAVVLTGCSNGKGTESATPTTAVASTTPPTLSVRPTSDDAYCRFLQTYNNRFGQIGPGLADPQRLRTTMREAAAAVKDGQATAPEALKADLAVLSDAFQRLLTVFEQANYDITRLSLTSLQELQSPAVVGASQRIDAYTKEHCLPA